MSGIFSPVIFNDTIFNTGVAGMPPPPPPEEPIRTRPGDGGKSKRKVIHAVKPTGLLGHRKSVPEGRKTIDERLSQSLEIQAEVASEIAREAEAREGIFEEQVLIAQMSLSEIEFEIAALMQKKMKTEEDEMILFLLIMAAVF